MDYSNIKNNFINKIEDGNTISFEGQEEYYFILGQFLVYVFHLLGGTQNYTKEFNYFTNSYITHPIQKIAVRILKFTNKITQSTLSNNPTVSKVYQALIENESKYTNNSINQLLCTDSFYRGIHSDNLFI